MKVILQLQERLKKSAWTDPRKSCVGQYNRGNPVTIFGHEINSFLPTKGNGGFKLLQSNFNPMKPRKIPNELRCKSNITGLFPILANKELQTKPSLKYWVTNFRAVLYTYIS